MLFSISASVGLPPPSFLSHPFFLHLSRFRLGIPYSLEITLTSSPEIIYNKLNFYPFDGLHLFINCVLPVGSSDSFFVIRVIIGALVPRCGTVAFEKLKRSVGANHTKLVFWEDGVFLKEVKRTFTINSGFLSWKFNCLWSHFHVFQMNLIFGK